MARYIIILAVLLATTATVAFASFYPQCNTPVSQYCGRTNCNVFYVDPAGSDNGDGSSANPWKTVATALSQVKSRTLSSNDGTFPPTSFVDKNPSGIIVGGDVIALRNGVHSKITVQNFYNEIPVTITGDQGHTPIVHEFSLASSANWIIKCLNFTSPNPNPGLNIVSIGSGFQGPSYENIFEKNTVYSYTDLEFYRGKPQQYLFNASATAVFARDTKSLILRDNYLYHNKRGIVMMSENTIVQRNVINYVIGDGFRILHNNSLVEFNLVQNSMNVDDGKDHRDGLQMFTNGNQFNLVNVTIRNNRFFSGVDHNRPFAASFQGISSFDVLLFNVTVENNLVLIEADYHGIALYKSKDCVIMSNTVHNPTGATNAWITTNGGVSGNVVQNNIANALTNIDGAVSVANAVKRWTPQEVASYFVDAENFNYRLRDNATSPFIGLGNSTNAPEIDNDGNFRSGDYDIGCYAFKPVSNPAVPPTISDSPTSGTNSPSNGPGSSVTSDTSLVQQTGLVSLVLAALAWA
jgi:hypothetical protein